MLPPDIAARLRLRVAYDIVARDQGLTPGKLRDVIMLGQVRAATITESVDKHDRFEAFKARVIAAVSTAANRLPSPAPRKRKAAKFRKIKKRR